MSWQEMKIESRTNIEVDRYRDREDSRRQFSLSLFFSFFFILNRSDTRWQAKHIFLSNLLSVSFLVEVSFLSKSSLSSKIKFPRLLFKFTPILSSKIPSSLWLKKTATSNIDITFTLFSRQEIKRSLITHHRTCCCHSWDMFSWFGRWWWWFRCWQTVNGNMCHPN